MSNIKSKYITQEQRELRTKISKLANRCSYHRRKYLFFDMQMTVAKQKLQQLGVTYGKEYSHS